MSNVKEWFSSNEWSEGVQVPAHTSINLDQFYKQYHARPDLWKAVFEFMKQDLMALEAGKYALVGDEAFAMVSEYETKVPENARWEAHRKYIDLQFVISGEEKMGILPLDKVVDPQDYNELKDLIFYGENSGDYYLANSSSFFLFFPTDVHRPSIKIKDPKVVKKLVVKIAVAK